MVNKVYKPKIDGWIYLIPVMLVLGCIIVGLCNGGLILSLMPCIILIVLWILVLMGVRYEISDNKLGIRNLYRWTWIPVDKIGAVEKLHGVFVQGSISATTSLDRVRITMSDRSALKSSMPIDITPGDRDGFIARLKEINPSIIVKN